jgi:hypothetical protein
MKPEIKLKNRTEKKKKIELIVLRGRETEEKHEKALSLVLNIKENI